MQRIKLGSVFQNRKALRRIFVVVCGGHLYFIFMNFPPRRNWEGYNAYIHLRGREIMPILIGVRTLPLLSSSRHKNLCTIEK